MPVYRHQLEDLEIKYLGSFLHKADPVQRSPASGSLLSSCVLHQNAQIQTEASQQLALQGPGCHGLLGQTLSSVAL